MVVVRNHVLAALANGVDAGNDDVAREVAARADWILRGAIKRRLDHALIDASLLAGEHVSAADPDAIRHVQRVAALNVAGKLEIDACDRIAVEVAYCELSWPMPSRAPVFTLLVLLNLAIVMSTVLWLVLALRHSSHHDRVHPAHIVGTGAFVHGGTPARDEKLEALLDNLTQLVIETDADRRGSSEGAPRARRVEELREPAIIVAYGPALARDWRRLIDALDQFADLPSHGPKLRAAIKEMSSRAQAVNDRFIELGLGYYIQADGFVDQTVRAAVFVYRVEDVSFMRAGGQARRVLGLRRLDEMNLDLALLGRQRDNAGDPIVMLDHVDGFVDDHVLPALQEMPYPLGDASFASSSRGRRLQIDASEAIRSELIAAHATDRESVTRLVIATVRRHEARHGIDLDREHPLRYPKALAQIAGPQGDSTIRAELELAAYTSQIGNDSATPQLALWNLATHGFNADHAGTAEADAAVIVIQGLARQLGMNTGTVVSKNGHVDRDGLAAAGELLAAQSDDKLRMAARQLWMELYGEPMLPIVDPR